MNIRTDRLWAIAAFAVAAVGFTPALAGSTQGLAQQASTPPAVEATPAQRRAIELLNALTSYDLATSKRFIEQSFSPDTLAKRPLDAWLGQMLAEELKIRGGSFVGWQNISDTEAQLVFRNELFDRLEVVGVEVEPVSPHRIIDWTPPKPLPSNTPPPKTDQELATRLHSFAQRLAHHDFFSGTVLIARGDTPILAQAYGLAERNFRVPNRLDTKMRTASLTKPFTAVAIGQLVDQGKLSLEDPVSKFLPDVPGGDKVLIRHLLNHTSAIGDWALDTFWSKNPIDFRDLNDWIEISDEAPPKNEPGTSFEYNNLAYLYLGKIIEKLSGRDYYSYVEDQVFKRAGMINTACPHMDAAVPKMAYPYGIEFELGEPTYVNMMLRDGARGGSEGCAVTTVGDMLRFANALRADTLLKPQTLVQFTTPSPETGSRLWGLGFYTRKLGQSDIMTIGHGGNSAGTCTQFAMFEHEGVPWTYVVLSNSGLRACRPMVSEISDQLAQRLVGAAK